MQSKYATLPFLPKTTIVPLTQGITLLEPLSRRGTGPGIIVLVSESGLSNGSTLRIENGVPSPLMKWGEEGLVVVEVTEAALAADKNALNTAASAIRENSKTESKGKIGLVVYTPRLWEQAAPLLSQTPDIAGAVVYGTLGPANASLQTAGVPVIQHLPGKADGLPIRSKTHNQYEYVTAKSYLFATPFNAQFDYAAEAVSHTRNLNFIKPILNGPYFDLEAIWDEHTYYEFENRSVECTMNTMVQEPYVNHIPTLTGGIGRENLTAFYRDHFIFVNSEDVDQELVSRSVAIDRVIDEFLFKCTHDRQLDWLIPGIPPTHRKLEIPFTAVVNIRGDRLYHEHIAWDQATVLRQLGLLPEYLPFPQGLANGLGEEAMAQAAGVNGNGNAKKNLEYKLPVTGADTARKLKEKNAVPSNQMFENKLRAV